MECFEARALKPSLRREIAMNKTTQQPLYDDVFLYATGFSGVSVEEFPIDDLLDFSNGNFDEEFPLAEEEEEDYEKDSLNSVSSQDGAYDYNSTSFSGAVDFTSDELAVPVDDLENLELEWLSNFVDDSVSESSLFDTVGRERTGISAPNRFEPGRKPAFRKLTCFPSTVPAKPRTKRPRTASRVWSLGSPSLTESSSSLSSPSSSSGSLSSCQTTELLHNFEEPPTKKLNRKKPVQSGEQGGSQVQRRCSHCHVQKTPQWRAGPLGAKTLCNACGVRYKSGRLFPEYRPACSPTFSGDVHSNSHRKVLEIRRKKEVINGVDSGLVQMVSSF